MKKPTKFNYIINIIAILFIGYYAFFMNGASDISFKELFYIQFFLIALGIISIIHLFFIKGLKDKISVVIYNLLPILILSLIISIMAKDLMTLVVGVVIFLIWGVISLVIQYGLSLIINLFKKEKQIKKKAN